MDEPDALATYFLLTARVPSPGATAWLNRLSTDYGEERLSVALAEEHKVSSLPNDFLSRTEQRLRRAGLIRAQEAEGRRLAAERAELESYEARMTPEVRAANMARLRRQLEEAGLL